MAQKRPNSSIAMTSNSNSDNLQQRTTFKKVKVLCQQSKDPNQLGSPQPLLASSNSQKNINMVKALQQINQMMQSQNFSNSLSTMSQISSANIINQPNLKTTHSTKNLLQQQQQLHLLHSQNSQQSLQNFAKSPKPITQNLINMPLSLKSSQINAPSNKFKQIQQKASGILMQKCESHQSLLQYNQTNQKTASKQKIHQQNKENQQSLSPSEKNGKSLKRSNKHNRQSSIINFNIISSNNQGLINHHQLHHQNSQKSLSPINKVQKDQTSSKYQTQSRQSNERIKSLDNHSLEKIQNAISNKQQALNDKQKNAVQQIRISPQKQFFVQPCLTQQTSPSEQFRKHSTKITLKNPNKQQNLILEQDNYLLPQHSSDDEVNEQQQYSLKKDYQTLVHHNHKMVRDNQSQGKHPRESEESINKGFLTDRQQSSGQDLHNIIGDIQPSKKKTKGISYTRNAQELKKLLLETGVIGNLGLTSSLATAAAGMISQTQDTLFIKNNDITTKSTKNVSKNQTAKVKNSEIFSFSTKGKSNKMVTDKSQKQQNQQLTSTCLLENQMLLKKGSHQRIQSQLENNSQTNTKANANMYSTQDQSNPMFPQSTQNKLRDFILKEEEESPSKQYQNYIDDQVIYSSKRLSKSPQIYVGYQNNGFPSRRSPSSQIALKEDSQSNINFPFTETEQLIQRNENKRKALYSGIVIDMHTQKQGTQYMNRCWTAHGDISTERDMQHQYVLKELDINSTGQIMHTNILSEESRIENINYNKPIHQKGLQKNNQHAQSHLILQKRQSCNSSQSKNTCFTYNNNNNNNNKQQHNHIQQQQQYTQSPIQRYQYSSMLSDGENMPPNILYNHQNTLQNNDMTQKELEILKFKMIAFVKTYENQFQKMKIQMSELQQENQQLKKKLNTIQNRRMSASISTNTNHNSQYSGIVINKAFNQQNPTCLTSAHTSQIH